MNLKISESSSTYPWYRTLTVSGFTQEEMNELGSMEHGEAERKVIDMLDARNSGYGTALKCGYGIYGFWISGANVCLRVGRSCD